MDHNTSNIPSDLASLEAECPHVFRSSKAQAHNSAFNSKLQRATNKYRESTEPQVLQSLIRSWLWYMNKIVTQYTEPFRYVSDMNIFLKLVLTKDLVEYVTNTAEKEKLMLGVCLFRSQLAENKNTPHPRANNVHDFLMQWLGKAPTIADLSSVQKTSDFLFGSAAWLLFHAEADSDTKRIRYLIEQGLPLLPKKTNTYSYNSTNISELPADFS